MKDEPAFPPKYVNNHGMVFEAQKAPQGLTKREYFAAKAMSGLLANSVPGVHYRIEKIPPEAVAYADALMKELEK